MSDQRTSDEDRPDPEQVDLGKGSREEQQGGRGIPLKPDKDKEGPIPPRPGR
ncbi:MAG: hypothetical protein QOH81_526 [Sphingomonadales bacterium]|nr:hypothetical protein [Sphingomonadales bacterium]